jgi:hypothetical protein
MRIDLVTLCDAALEVNGRLHVLGSIDYFWAATLPYIHPKCALAIRLRWDGFERIKKHRVRIQIVDADGGSIATEFNVKCSPPVPQNEDVPAVRHIILDLQSIRFENYGPYAIRIEVDGAELVSLPFSIVPLRQFIQQQRV